eukprot:RCo034496
MKGEEVSTATNHRAHKKQRTGTPQQKNTSKPKQSLLHCHRSHTPRQFKKGRRGGRCRQRRKSGEQVGPNARQGTDTVGGTPTLSHSISNHRERQREKNRVIPFASPRRNPRRGPSFRKNSRFRKLKLAPQQLQDEFPGKLRPCSCLRLQSPDLLAAAGGQRLRGTRGSRVGFLHHGELPAQLRSAVGDVRGGFVALLRQAHRGTLSLGKKHRDHVLKPLLHQLHGVQQLGDGRALLQNLLTARRGVHQFSQQSADLEAVAVCGGQETDELAHSLHELAPGGRLLAGVLRCGCGTLPLRARGGPLAGTLGREPGLRRPRSR